MGNTVGCGHTYYNAWEGNDEREIAANEMSELESYEVETVDRGYHVYMAVWEAAVGQILPCQQEGGNIIDPYAFSVVENNDTPIDNDTPHSMKIFTVKTFANCPTTVKSFHSQKILTIWYMHIASVHFQILTPATVVLPKLSKF